MKPAWIIEAEKYIGLKEIKGPEHNPEILQWWKDIKRGGIQQDSVPWCSAFVGAMLERSGIKSSRFEGALSYLEWGMDITAPAYGCVVVFSRSVGGHVGFVVGDLLKTVSKIDKLGETAKTAVVSGTSVSEVENKEKDLLEQFAAI